jgi:hypothetical protein
MAGAKMEKAQRADAKSPREAREQPRTHTLRNPHLLQQSRALRRPRKLMEKDHAGIKKATEFIRTMEPIGGTAMVTAFITAQMKVLPTGTSIRSIS